MATRALLLCLLLFASCGTKFTYAPPAARMLVGTKVYATDFETVWSRASRWFAVHSDHVQVTSIDKASGWIGACNPGPVSPDVLDVGVITADGAMVEGPVYSHALAVDVLVRRLGDGTEATINVAGFFDAEAWASMALVPFRLTRAGRSTGALEQSFHTFLANGR